jgi:hypothetical protein
MSPSAERPLAPPKSSTMGKLLSGFVGLCVVVIVLARFSGVADSFLSQTNEANNLKDQAVVSLNAADKHVEAVNPLVDKVFSADNIAGVPATRAAFTEDAKKGLAECQSGATEYRKGAGLLGEASNLRINDHYKKYLQLKSKQMELFADIRENLGEQFELMLNPAETDGARLKEKLEAMDVKIADLVRQRDAAGAEADKITAEHPDVFTK